MSSRATSRLAIVFGAIAAAILAFAPRPVSAQDTASTGVVIVAVPAPTPATPAAPVPLMQPQPYAPSAAPVARRHTGASIGLIVSGSVLLGVGWIVNFLVGLGAGTDPFDGTSQPEWDTFRAYSFIPAAGPWAQLAVKPTSFTHDAWGGWLVVDGLLQGAGVALLIAGIAVAASGDEQQSADRGGVRWALAPFLGPTQAGLSVAGTF